MYNDEGTRIEQARAKLFGVDSIVALGDFEVSFPPLARCSFLVCQSGSEAEGSCFRFAPVALRKRLDRRSSLGVLFRWC